MLGSNQDFRVQCDPQVISPLNTTPPPYAGSGGVNAISFKHEQYSIDSGRNQLMSGAKHKVLADEYSYK